MQDNVFTRAPRRAFVQAIAWSEAVLAMTVVHHVYGAWLFDTPFRLHIAFVALPAMLLIAVLALYARQTVPARAGALSSWFCLVLMAVFAIAMIGFYEGGFNHLLPNIQYLLGIIPTVRDDLYVPPDDLIFQGTGVAQFVIAAFALFHLVGLFRAARRNHSVRQIPCAASDA